MKNIGLGLLINGKEVAGVNGLMDEKEGVPDYEQLVEWKREGRNEVFGDNILEAYKKLTGIAKEKYPENKYRIIIDVEK